ncbi:hypothetical protein HPO96_34470 [Kribbella sandramycini]|uniref:Uncharacterized protein n=1 Tax=Kribbella sandramycini TaxID=60450 RepID=A0A7Y4P4P7_9ACTN|nr:hypothetical protein [Kribbella sandramycini]MBB6570133.1 hypothetical protein [Kribbella sandramycini]NOL45365.1 hypothetical protein [Kribbella sandramycini]
MNTGFRRNAVRLAAAVLATTALGGAAIAGASAATAATSCDSSPIVKTFDTVLKVRNGFDAESPTCR